MLIRSFQPKDAHACARILHQNFHGFKESRKGYIPDEIVERRLIDVYTPEELRRRSQEHSYWVAEHEGDIVGLIGMKRPVEGKAEVVNFYLSSDHARRGIGRKLLDALRTHAAEQGVRRLYVYSVLTAHTAYEKLGFQHLPEHDKFLRRTAPSEFNERFSCSHAPAGYRRAQTNKLDQFYFEMQV